MYNELKLTNGDLTFDEFGRLVFISDKEAIIQRILVRLNTKKEELFYNSRYGINLDDLREKRLEKNLFKIQSVIEDCLLEDEIINSVDVTLLERLEWDKFILKLNIILEDGEIIAIEYEF